MKRSGQGGRRRGRGWKEQREGKLRGNKKEEDVPRRDAGSKAGESLVVRVERWVVMKNLAKKP